MPTTEALRRLRATLLDLSASSEIDDYLDHALDLQPAAREVWLTDLATTKPAIAGTLRELLAKLDKLNASGFLDNSALCLPGLPPPHTPMAGKRVGAYTIERILGRGGMGEVWLASRNDGRFEGYCAIKFLDTSVAQPRLADRFRHEGRVLARLAHPNIARLIDAGTTDEDRQYLVLEYVDGEPLDRYCEARSLPIAARVRLFLDVVSAVAHAHSSLIVHRDLKPSNVFVTRDGAVKLLDFGIARLMSAEPGDPAPGMTRFEEQALTPEYAAPEQLLGEPHSTATDVYQLGMLLYVLLTGRHPLPQSGARVERIKAALEGHVPLASDFSAPPLRKQLRGDLDSILSMALRRDPAERYVTAAALREDLARYLSGEPVSARRGATLYLVRKFVRRHRLAVLASAVAVASLCAALVFAFGQARVADRERDRALALSTRNEAVTEFMGTVITEAAEADKPITVSDMLARSEALALANNDDNRENRAAVLGMLAAHYHALQNHPQAAQLLEKALALLANSPEQGLRAELRCGHALVISSMGRRAEALEEIGAEIANLPSDPKSAAECLHTRALVAAAADDARGALSYSMEALTRLRSTARPSKQQQANYLETVAGAYHLTGRHKESFEYFAMALRMITELGRERGPYGMIIRNNWAVASEAAGTPKRALQLHDETARILAEREPGNPPPTFLVLNRARALEAIGRFREAQAAYESGLELATKAANKYARFYCLIGLASTAKQLADGAGTDRYFAQAQSVLDAAEPPNSIPSMRVAVMRGKLELAAGRFAAARAQFQRGLGGKPNRPTWIDAALGGAEAELLAGDAAAAVATARRALGTAQAMQGGIPYSNRAGLSYLMLGRASSALGERDAAHQAFAAAVTNLANTVDADHPALLEARLLLAGDQGLKGQRT